MSEAPLIQLEGITKTFGTGPAAFQALKGVNLAIDRGDFVAIMGPSGSGKSTTMNILGCLDTPTSGTFRFRGLSPGRYIIRIQKPDLASGEAADGEFLDFEAELPEDMIELLRALGSQG